MRGAFVAMDEGIVVAYAREIFTSYWTNLRDISLDEVLREIEITSEWTRLLFQEN
ncbi:MAG: hypothetical protein CM1200mP24_04750 [Gammaproteobacteria bacterium]|nr:MAG: hypothetical protein CM1200mP24_04750 [Gammaproteobacteria bacterium]